MEDNNKVAIVANARGNMQAHATQEEDDDISDDQKPAWTPSAPWSMGATHDDDEDDNDDEDDRKAAGILLPPWSVKGGENMEASQTNMDSVIVDQKPVLGPTVSTAVSEKTTNKANDVQDEMGWVRRSRRTITQCTIMTMGMMEPASVWKEGQSHPKKEPKCVQDRLLEERSKPSKVARTGMLVSPSNDTSVPRSSESSSQGSNS
jgi:hypothetical protein